MPDGGEVEERAGVVGHPEDEDGGGHGAGHGEGDGGDAAQQQPHVARLAGGRWWVARTGVAVRR